MNVSGLTENGLHYLHEGNHGDFGNLHDQYQSKIYYHKTSNTDGTTATQYCKIAIITIDKTKLDVLNFFKLDIHEGYNQSMLTGELYISVKTLPTNIITAYFKGNSARSFYFNFVYNIDSEDASTQVISIYVCMNLTYRRCVYSLALAHSYQAWNSTMYDSQLGINLLDTQDFDVKPGTAITIPTNTCYNKPTSNDGFLGEVRWNQNTATGKYAAFVCTTAPSTWTGIGQMGASMGVTGSRPTGVEPGYLYLDTTLSASGKPIWWNGTSWVEATLTTQNYKKIRLTNPSATIDTYGTATVLTHPDGFKGLSPNCLDIVFGGTFGAETVTAQVIVTYADTTTYTFTKTATVAGTVSLTNAEMMTLIKDGTYITQSSVSCKSSIASSTATVSFNGFGIYL